MTCDAVPPTLNPAGPQVDNPGVGNGQRTPPGNGALSLDVSTSERGTTVHVHGELDFATAPLLEAAIERLVAEPAGDVRLDLAGVPFIDSSGVAALIRGDRRLQTVGARLRLARPTERVLRTFLAVRLPEIVPLEDETG